MAFDEEVQTGGECIDIPWQCSRCETLLGLGDRETRRNVRIKAKDIYIYIEEPKRITITCRKCGFPNVLGQIDEPKGAKTPDAAVNAA